VQVAGVPAPLLAWPGSQIRVLHREQRSPGAPARDHD
jgi:hypothetical protein